MNNFLKIRPIDMLPTNTKFKDTLKLKVKGWKKIFQENGKQNKAG